MIDVTCIMCLAVHNLVQQAQRRAETETAAFIYSLKNQNFEIRLC